MYKNTKRQFAKSKGKSQRTNKKANSKHKRKNTRYRRRLQEGGVKLKDPSKTGFIPIYDMMISPGARVQLISDSSLKSFVFQLDVAEEYAEYNDFVDGSFSKPVTSYILKLVIMSPQLDASQQIIIPRYMSTDGKEHLKEIEKSTSLYKEASLQQYVWKESVAKLQEEVCPPIANLSILEHHHVGLFLNELLRQVITNPTPDTPKVQHVIEYFAFVIGNSYLETTNDANERTYTQIPSFEYSLGILVMPSLPYSITIQKLNEYVIAAEPMPVQFTEEVSVDNSTINSAILCLLFKVVWLFIMIQVIHLDMHLNNCLLFLKPPQDFSCMIIDFGLAVNLNDENDELFTAEYKARISGMSQEARERIMTSETPEEKISAITYVLSTISSVDREHLRILYQHLTPEERAERNVLQMNNLMNWYANVVTDEMKIRIVDNIKELITRSSTPNEAFLRDVAESEATRQIAHFRDPIDAFIIGRGAVPP